MRSLLSSSREQSNAGGGGASKVQLYLNVYDLTPINNYLYWFGLGIFHSGIEVHGMEYGYGAHEYPASGVFEVEPKSCPGFIYRRSLLLGTTDMSRSDFRSFIENLSVKYHGDTYHLIAKNCNHFTDDVCKSLTGKPIPGWVNRLARLGSFCNCLLPQSIQIAAVRHLPDQLAFSDEIPDHIFCMGKINFSDDGSESFGSIEESDDDDPDHHLLMIPNGEIVHSRDKLPRAALDNL